jgi:nicotinamidase-related amidase
MPEPRSTALLLMHFQNDIVHPDGAFGPSRQTIRPALDAMLAAAASAQRAARASGVPVIHVAVAFRPGYPDLNRRSPLFAGIEQRGALVEGDWGAAFHEAIAPQPGDLTVVSRGMSAFGGSDVDLLLRLANVNAVALAGFATNGVVESTARDAVDRGLGVTVLEDCCAASSEETHRAALVFLRALGDMSTAGAFFVSR